MILECENCGTCYETSAALPPEGRKVRCARCGHVWHAMPKPEDELDQELFTENESRNAVEDHSQSEDLENDELTDDVLEDVQNEDLQDDNSLEDTDEAEDNSDLISDTAPNIDILPPLKPELDTDPGIDFREPDETLPQEASLSFDGDGDVELEAWGDAAPQGEVIEHSEEESADVTDVMPEVNEADINMDVSLTEDTLDKDLFEAEETTDNLTFEETETVSEEGPLAAAKNPIELNVEEDLHQNAFEEPPKRRKKRFPSRAKKPSFLGPQNLASLRKMIFGWGGLITVSACILVMLYANRINIVKTLPGAVHLYQLVGLDVNIRSLEFKSIVYKTSTKDGRPSMKVSGTIVNITNEAVPIPTVVFAFIDEDGAELYHMARRVDSRTLPANRRLNFNFHLNIPPVAAKSLQVRFAKKSHL